MYKFYIIVLIFISATAFAKAKDIGVDRKPSRKPAVSKTAVKSEKTLKCSIFEKISGEKKRKIKSKCSLPFSMWQYSRNGRSFYRMDSCTLNYVPPKDKGGINGLVSAMITLDSSDPNHAKLSYKFLDGSDELKSQSFEYYSKEGGVFKATDEQLLVISRQEADAEKKQKGRTIAMTCATK